MRGSPVLRQREPVHELLTRVYQTYCPRLRILQVLQPAGSAEVRASVGRGMLVLEVRPLATSGGAQRRCLPDRR